VIGAEARMKAGRPTQRPGDDFDYEAAIVACAGGNNLAFRALYDREAPKMLGVAMRLLKRQSLAEDAVHDAFVNIWNKAATFDAKAGSARGWIYTILRNRALNMLRSEGRLEHKDEFETLAATAADDDPEAVVSGLSDASALRRCLEGLDPQRRSILVLSYVHGLTQGELAGRLGVPLGTMKSWIRRSLLSLKECMG
jgi:RNA polymerase sigma factor (sigma-70 family)